MEYVTERGFQVKRYEEVFDEIAQGIYEELGEGVDLSEKTSIGILVSLIARSQTDVWEALQEVYSGQRVSEAVGINLDDIVALNNVYRLDAAPSLGNLEVTGQNGTNISVSVDFRSTADDLFNSLVDLTITNNRCIEVTLSVNTVVEETRYSIVVDGTEYSYISQIGDGEEEILQGLEAEFDPPNDTIMKADYDSDTVTLRVYRDTEDREKRESTVNVSTTSFLTYEEVVTITPIRSKEEGPIPGQSGTIIYVESNISGLEGVYNRYDLVRGRPVESDAALRERFYNSAIRSGTATQDTILAAVRSVLGVSSAAIEENDGETTDGAGLPPKSFRVTVAGGDENAIAQAIWDTKPVAIRDFGSQSGTALDIDGNDHIMYFERPTALYVFVNLEYSIHDEEQQGTEIETGIEIAISKYGATLGTGDDIIPNRILGYVYDEVDGIIVESVECATNTSQVDPVTGYTSDRISISSSEYTIWDSSQYTITVV